MKFIIVFLFVLNLSGCSPYKSGFDCPAGSGKACTSLYKINRLVDRGELGQLEEEDPMNADLPKNLTNCVEVYFPSRTDTNGLWHEGHSLFIPRDN